MSQPLVLHRLERLLVTVVDSLGAEFPDIPLEIVSRCVQAARSIVHPETVADLPRLAVTVQGLARDDLRRIRFALDDTTAVPTS